MALVQAGLVAVVAALIWAFFKGVLEFPGALGVALVGGWLIGEVLWSVRANPLLAAAVAGLVLYVVAALFGARPRTG